MVRYLVPFREEEERKLAEEAELQSRLEVTKVWWSLYNLVYYTGIPFHVHKK